MLVIVFTKAIASRTIKDGLTDRTDDENWKCGICYVNMDVSFSIMDLVMMNRMTVFVLKRELVWDGLLIWVIPVDLVL